MSSELVQLDQRDTSVHGRRYTEDERAGAYLYWRTIAGRSCRKVGLKFNIAWRTIQSWRDSYDWIARANEEDHDDYASSHHGVAAIVINELVPNIEVARAIRDDPNNSARDRLAALQWLSGLAGISPVSKIETATTDRRGTVVEVIPEFQTMSIQEIREYELSKRAPRSG